MKVIVSVGSKNWLKASLVLHTRELKEDNGKTIKNAEWYGVCEGSPVEVSKLYRTIRSCTVDL